MGAHAPFVTEIPLNAFHIRRALVGSMSALVMGLSMNFATLSHRYSGQRVILKHEL